MDVLLTNPMAVFWIALTVMTIVPTGLSYWFKAHKAELDTQLKLKMLEKGMSAADIERVLRAEGAADTSGE